MSCQPFVGQISIPIFSIPYETKESHVHGCKNVLSGEDLVVHEEELDVVDVLDEESLVAGRHHVLGSLVGAIADLIVDKKICLTLAHP